MKNSIAAVLRSAGPAIAGPAFCYSLVTQRAALKDGAIPLIISLSEIIRARPLTIGHDSPAGDLRDKKRGRPTGRPHESSKAIGELAAASEVEL